MCNFEAFFSFFYIFCLSVLAVRLYKRKPLIFVLRKMACKYHFRQMFQQILCLHWYMNYSTQNKTDSAWITKPVHCLIYSAIGAFLLYVCICRLTASLYERSRQPRGLLPGHQPTTLILTVKRLLRHKSSLHYAEYRSDSHAPAYTMHKFGQFKLLRDALFTKMMLF